MQNRKENEEKLLEIINREELEIDCNNTNNVAMKYIKKDAVKHLEELRIEYIKLNHIQREEQVIINKLFAFLKEKS